MCLRVQGLPGPPKGEGEKGLEHMALLPLAFLCARFYILGFPT